MMKLTRWLAGSVAALGVVLAVVSVDRAQALSLGSPGAAAAVKGTATDSAIQVRFGHFHGGFGHFHGIGHRGFFRPRVFIGPRFAYAPVYYAPVYRCPVVWTVYGPRRICGFRPHYVHYWRHRHFHRYHYVHRFRHHRWM